MIQQFEDKDTEYSPEVDDVITESDDIDETDGNALARIAKLKEELKVCQSERKEYLDGWQRMKADYFNSKKRYDEERLQIASRSEDGFIERLLPLCDSFDMALAHADQSALGAGISQIAGQLRSLLQSFDVTVVGQEGEAFNPMYHEALQSEAVTDEEKNDTIIRVLQKGYVRRDKLLRPAKVIIGAFGN